MDDDNWPAGSSLSVPDTWALAYLGDVAPAPPNRAPTAVAPPDRALAPLVPTAVYLDGTESSDPDGDPLSFDWQQVSGPAVLLHGADISTSHFSALPVASQTELVFELVVSDGLLDSSPVPTTVRLFPVAQPPLPTPDPADAIPEFVIVAAPGNPTDVETGFGAVDEVYEAGTVEVPNGAYVDFLNHVAATDTNALYDLQMTSDPRGGILRSGAPGAYTYDTKPYMAMKPVNFVSWLDAARYVNWLENGKPAGPQDPTTTEKGSYDLTIPSPGQDTGREVGARYVLGSENEWFKAAYYDPGLSGYWIYPTTSNQVPTPSTATAMGSAANPGPETSNHGKGAIWNGLRGNVIGVGSTAAPSPYDTLDQGGNVEEWLETAEPTGTRVVRGGSYASDDLALLRNTRSAGSADFHGPELGFRVFRVDGSADPDWDVDGFSDGRDNCPVTPNSDQTPSVDDPDIGLACLCGDVDEDGSVKYDDGDLVREYLAGLIPSVPVPEKCQASPADSCDLLTSVIIHRTAAGLTPAPQQVCPAALGP
jgi:formylglycine-generating enzyme required for sulfatase activity